MSSISRALPGEAGEQGAPLPRVAQARQRRRGDRRPGAGDREDGACLGSLAERARRCVGRETNQPPATTSYGKAGRDVRQGRRDRSSCRRRVAGVLSAGPRSRGWRDHGKADGCASRLPGGGRVPSRSGASGGSQASLGRWPAHGGPYRACPRAQGGSGGDRGDLHRGGRRRRRPAAFPTECARSTSQHMPPT